MDKIGSARRAVVAENDVEAASPSSDRHSTASPSISKLNRKALEQLSRSELVDRVMGLTAQVEATQTRRNGESASKVDERLRRHQAEAQRRENILVMRLASKEQEVQDFLGQLEELRTSLGGGLRNALLDPVINSIFQKTRDELRVTKEKLEQSQQELNAWKFTPDSNTGKRLMAKCRNLIQENEELGKMIESGRLARLEGELALQRQQADDLRRGQSEVDDFLVELDEDMEGLQTTVMFVQQQLREAQRDNRRLRRLLGEDGADSTLAADADDHSAVAPPPPPRVSLAAARSADEQDDEEGETARLASGADYVQLNGDASTPPPPPPPPRTLSRDPHTGDYLPRSPETAPLDEREEGELETPERPACDSPPKKRARHGRCERTARPHAAAAAAHNGVDTAAACR